MRTSSREPIPRKPIQYSRYSLKDLLISEGTVAKAFNRLDNDNLAEQINKLRISGNDYVIEPCDGLRTGDTVFLRDLSTGKGLSADSLSMINKLRRNRHAIKCVFVAEISDDGLLLRLKGSKTFLPKKFFFKITWIPEEVMLFV